MSNINFVNPYLLFLALPLAALFLVPFFLAIRRDNVNGHNIASCVLHLVMAVLIAFSAAGTSIVTTMTETDVYVLADVSYSANRNLDKIDEYVAGLSGALPNNSRMGVICFGKNYQLLTRLGERRRSVKEAAVDDSATDIVGALDYAGSLFRDDVIKRLVVITDGKETNGNDAGALKRQVDALADRNIHVDAIYLDDNLQGDSAEVQLSSVDYTHAAFLNREERATVTIRCNCPEKTESGGDYATEAVLTLFRGGESYAKKTVYLTKGVNTESFLLPTDEAGVYDYEFLIEAAEDGNPHNNRLSFTQTVNGKMNVLFIGSETADYAAVKQLFPEEQAEIDAYINLRQVPLTVEELCVYDEIVLSDLDVTTLGSYELFLESLDTAVSLFGKTLLTLGNTNIQGYPNGELKPLSNMLPVMYGRDEGNRKLYTLVFDVSRSMEFYEKLAHAKRAATEIVKMLSDDCRVKLITFSGSVSPSANYDLATSREELLSIIKNLDVSQGTNIGAGLNEALTELKLASGYSEKRVFLLSDGLNFTDEAWDPVKITEEMRDYDVYASTLDVGRGTKTDAAATQAKNLLQRIAQIGGGSYLDISSDASLEEVITKELPTEVNNAQGGMSYVGIKRRVDGVLEGLDNTALTESYVRNYYYGQAKAAATTVLTVDYRATASGKRREAPLYAYWDYGNGRVASFTSRLSGDWMGHWDAALKETLFYNIFMTNVPREKVDYPFVLEVTQDNGYAEVILTPANVRMDAVAKIEVTAPKGDAATGSMAFGSRSFRYLAVMPDVGKYTFEITYSYGGRTFTAMQRIDLSYSSEYDSFALYDAAVLHKMVGANGTVSEDGSLKIENDASEVGTYELSLALPLLIVCVVLYAVDIIVRKLKWEDVVSFFRTLGRRGGKS